MVESFTGVQVQHAASMRSLFMQSGECVQPFFILVFLSRFRYFATSICVSVAVDANEYYVCILVPHKCIDAFAQPVAITRLSVYFYTIVYDAHHVPINHASALHSQCKYSLFECCLPHTTRVAARRDHQRGLILRLSVICALCIWLLGDNKRPTTEQCEWCAGAFREPSQPKRVAGVISSSSTYSWVRTKDLHHFQSILFTFGSVLTFAVTSWRWPIECLFFETQFIFVRVTFSPVIDDWTQISHLTLVARPSTSRTNAGHSYSSIIITAVVHAAHFMVH